MHLPLSVTRPNQEAGEEQHNTCETETKHAAATVSKSLVPDVPVRTDQPSNATASALQHFSWCIPKDGQQLRWLPETLARDHHSPDGLWSDLQLQPG